MRQRGELSSRAGERYERKGARTYVQRTTILTNDGQ